MVCVPTTPPIDNANAKIHQEDVPPTDEDSHDYNNPWQDQITDVIEGSAQKKANPFKVFSKNPFKVSCKACADKDSVEDAVGAAVENPFKVAKKVKLFH